MPRTPLAEDVPYDALYHGRVAPQPLSLHAVGEFLRCSMGLSAWKQFGSSRWALRVNPSSGNLHPTETYIVSNGDVFHYAPKDHLLEWRAVKAYPTEQTSDVVRHAPDVVGRAFTARQNCFLVGLTSIHWREAWKYGERAFRYCQHDVGHALGALRLSAARLGWQLRLLPWADADIATLLGVDRSDDFAGAEREHVDCLAIVSVGDDELSEVDPGQWLEGATVRTWNGKANRLSPDRVEWPIIDEAAAATRFAGRLVAAHKGLEGAGEGPPYDVPVDARGAPLHGAPNLSARDIMLRRRSALAFDPTAGLRRDVFLSMLRRLDPVGPPWDAIDWPPHVHLALFVHRVEDVTPGLYVWLRDPAVLDAWRAAMSAEFLWERVDGTNLYLLVPIDCRRAANRLSCDQDIAADGFFSLGMIAKFESALREQGDWFYRRLFWECGLIGQVLYLEAEAAGARATGIGCFYDDPVHEVLGLTGHEWQSLYHFSMGVPLEDTRLTSEPGYAWER